MSNYSHHHHHAQIVIDPVAVRALAYDGTKHYVAQPRTSDTPPSGFSESSLGSSSSFALSASSSSSSSRREEHSRPSTSSGLNIGMRQLLMLPPQLPPPPASAALPPLPPPPQTQMAQMMKTTTMKTHPMAEAAAMGMATHCRRNFYPQLQQTAAPQPTRQPAWPVVIQLEEAPREQLELPRTDMDTFDTRMDRIQSWRNHSASARISIKTSPQRRGTSSETSHRQQQHLTHYRCTACDSSYASRQSLKRHAQGVRSNPACRTAVDYFLE